MEYIAVDQYGRAFCGLTRPRRDLLKEFGVTRALKMYVDDKEGNTFHTGYIICGHWLTVYSVTPWRRKA